MDLAPISEHDLQNFLEEFPDDDCCGIECGECPQKYQNMPEEVQTLIDNDEPYPDSYRCDQVWRVLIPEMYRRSLIDKKTMLGAMKQGEER